MTREDILKRVAQEAETLTKRLEELGLDSHELGYAFELGCLTAELKALKRATK